LLVAQQRKFLVRFAFRRLLHRRETIFDEPRLGAALVDKRQTRERGEGDYDEH
jgi:hypothetical protein